MIKYDLFEKKKPLLKYNMQFFAEKGDGDGTDNTGDDGDDDQDDDDQDDKGTDDKGKKSDKKVKFTKEQQEQIDEAIKERLKRERKKQDKKQDQSKDDKQGDKGSDDKSKATDDKVSNLEAKLLCYDHDVQKDCIPDVIALAKAYVDEDTDFEEAIEKVIKKYPQFVKVSGKKKDSEDDNDDDEEDTDNKKGSWGQRQKGQSKKTDAVEAAFLKRNPGMKID